MKTSEILDKVTLEFAGGGKLALSDYAPYISNGQEEVEGIGSGNSGISQYILEPDLYFCYDANDNSMYNSDTGLYNIDETNVYNIDDINIVNITRDVSNTITYYALYEKSRIQDRIYEEYSNISNISCMVDFSDTYFIESITQGYKQPMYIQGNSEDFHGTIYNINGKDYILIDDNSY